MLLRNSRHPLSVLSLILLFLLLEVQTTKLVAAAPAADDELRVARLQYRGGGDWYNDPSALTNLIRFARQHIPLSLSERYDDVHIGSRDLHRYAFAFLTGHGNFVVNEAEAANVREFVDNGGFLYIDDDWGLDPYVQEFFRVTFPDDEVIELPHSHPIYHQVFSFPDGIPKIHQHTGKPAQAFGIFRNGRLAVLYTYETSLHDGWAYDVHDNPEEAVQASLRMGTNLLMYAFTSSR
ncbi:protein of unknown function (DUF4159) [Cyclonatronum proteinivorum]|uniref:DUF4159 domain-containing protein n=2 Tax=Cyclonatronum proteinivorum TaxID=1457365 RepID=A0A345UJ48_9BACT|nr:protein of unknown function (DUF4159) [Cyclonatronum proteinivorum]